MIDEQQIYEHIVFELSVLSYMKSKKKLIGHITTVVTRVCYDLLYQELLNGMKFPEINVQIDNVQMCYQWVEIVIENIISVDICMLVYNDGKYRIVL